jgi:hypothetical protein
MLDGSSAVVPSNVSSSKPRRPHEPQMDQIVRKSRKRRRPKSKHQEPLAESSAQASTSANAAEQLRSWPWLSITEPPTTKHPPVFTKDGKCVIPQSLTFSDPADCLSVQPFSVTFSPSLVPASRYTRLRPGSSYQPSLQKEA